MMLTRLVAVALFILPATAFAQEQGDAKQGRAFSERVCAECHAVGPEGGMSPNLSAKSFKKIASRRETTVISLAAWMQSEHENMPHLMLKPEDLNDVITYIMSLKE